MHDSPSIMVHLSRNEYLLTNGVLLLKGRHRRHARPRSSALQTLIEVLQILDPLRNSWRLASTLAFLRLHCFGEPKAAKRMP
jgi:hypothetical protein